MARKKRNNTDSITETEENEIILDDESNDEVDTTDDEEIVDTEENSDEEIINVIDDEVFDGIVENLVENVVQTQNPTNKLINEIEIYISDFDVSEEVAIKLAQRVLGIGQTGVLDHRTLSAYDFVSNKEDFLNDYRNGRK